MENQTKERLDDQTKQRLDEYFTAAFAALEERVAEYKARKEDVEQARQQEAEGDTPTSIVSDDNSSPKEAAETPQAEQSFCSPIVSDDSPTQRSPSPQAENERRPLTAFKIFKEEENAKIKKEKPKISIMELRKHSKMISAKWKSLPIAQQRPYFDEEKRRKSEVVKENSDHTYSAARKGEKRKSYSLKNREAKEGSYEL